MCGDVHGQPPVPLGNDLLRAGPDGLHHQAMLVHELRALQQDLRPHERCVDHVGAVASAATASPSAAAATAAAYPTSFARPITTTWVAGIHCGRSP